MKILSISTFDTNKHQTTLLYPEGHFYSMQAWRDFWEIQPLVDNALRANKLRLTSKPLLCDKNNGKFHYLLINDKKPDQVLHFTVDEKLNYSANIIFDSIKNFIKQPCDVSEFVSALGDIHQSNTPPAPAPSNSPLTNASTTSTFKALRDRRDIHTVNIDNSIDRLNQITFSHDDTSSPVKIATPIKEPVQIINKSSHETHESFFQRLLHFFSFLLCCFHPETEPSMDQDTTPRKRPL